MACGAGGDAYTLVSYALGLNGRCDGKAFVRILRWLEGDDVLQQEPVEDEPLPRIDPAPALAMAVPLSKVREPRLLAWLARRQIPSSAPAGWLPSFEAPWWPMGYAGNWPVVIPACTGRGDVLSMHGIAIDVDAPTKTRWPKGASSRELLFADRSTRSWLSGKSAPPDRLLIVEGATDYLTAAPQMPTLGYFSGSAAALRTVPITSGTRVYCGVDADEKGDMYENEIANALAPHPVRRIPLQRLKHGGGA